MATLTPIYIAVLLCSLHAASAYEVQCGMRPMDRGSRRRFARDVDSLIVNGEEAQKNSWPWMAYINVTLPDGRNTLSGGSIIDKYWIITAAHSLFWEKVNKDVTKYEVWVGMQDIFKKESNKVMISVTNITIHPDYKRVTHPENDLALLYFEDGIPFNSKIQPVCLPCSEIPVGSNVILTGWGASKDETYFGQRRLHEVSLPIADSKMCQKFWNDKKATEKILCTEVVKGKDMCYGDDGGPLVYKRDDGWELQGVAGMVTEDTCGKEGEYSVFTKVTAYLPWIEKTMDSMCE